MNRAVLARWVMAILVATQLFGCIIRPWPVGGDRGHHRGEWQQERHEGHGERH